MRRTSLAQDGVGSPGWLVAAADTAWSIVAWKGTDVIGSAFAKSSLTGGAWTEIVRVAIMGGAVTHWPTEIAYFAPPTRGATRS